VLSRRARPIPDTNRMAKTIIEIQACQGGWKVHGTPTEPFFTGPMAIEHAIDYAREKIASLLGEIRVCGQNGVTITTISSDNVDDSSFRDRDLRPS
jgi:hypothetical protein